MSAKRRDSDYLSHILDAIARIESYLAEKDEARFLEDSMLRDAVIRNLEIVGEAAAKLSAEFKTAHASVPWDDIVGMRNRLIHGYFSVDLRIVWDTVNLGLPKLREQLEAITKLA
jgi:uncharacterized protein with HEPN domain